MVELACRTARPGGVTLVAVRIDNRVEAPGVDAHRVRLESRIDGPTWPPRVEGVPAAPWEGVRPSGVSAGSSDERSEPEARRTDRSDGGSSDERRESDADAASVVVPTGRVASLGFASPGEPVEPPVEVASVEPAATPRAGAADGASADRPDPGPEDVLRVFGDPSPPRDAVAPRPGTHRRTDPARPGDGP